MICNLCLSMKVTIKRIIQGKWGCNNGQACVSPDYILTTKEFAPKVVSFKKQLKRYRFLMEFLYLEHSLFFVFLVPRLMR